jgi:hypothetical protein
VLAVAREVGNTVPQFKSLGVGGKKRYLREVIQGLLLVVGTWGKLLPCEQDRCGFLKLGWSSAV